MDLKSAAILLISENEEEYAVLKNVGFTNICYEPSYLDAADFYRKNKKELEKFDLVLLGTSARFLKNFKWNLKQDMDDILEPNNINSIIYEYQYHESANYHYFLVNNSKVDLLLFVSYYILKKLKNPIKGTSVVKKEINIQDKILPKNKNDIKILFLGFYDESEDAKKYFEENGFTDVKIDSYEQSHRNYLNDLKYYDLVIGHENISCIAYLNKEVHNQQLETNKKTYLFVYSICDGYSSSKVQVVGSSSDLNESNCESEVVYSGDYKKGFKIMLDLIMNLYSKYNKLDDFEPVDDFSKYEEETNRIQKFINRNNAITQKLIFMNNLINYCYQASEQYKMLSYTKSLKIKKSNDSISLSMYVGPREVASLIFYDFGFSNTFYLQRLSEKGKLLPPKKIVIPSYKDDKIEYAISDDEIKVIEGIYKRVNEEFVPQYNRVKQNEKNENKRRVRKWD